MPRREGHIDDKSVLLTLAGETHSVYEWARRTGLGRKTIEKRLEGGWSIERTLTTPGRVYRKKRKPDDA